MNERISNLPIQNENVEPTISILERSGSKSEAGSIKEEGGMDKSLPIICQAHYASHRAKTQRGTWAYFLSVGTPSLADLEQAGIRGDSYSVIQLPVYSHGLFDHWQDISDDKAKREVPKGWDKIEGEGRQYKETVKDKSLPVEERIVNIHSEESGLLGRLSNHRGGTMGKSLPGDFEIDTQILANGDDIYYASLVYVKGRVYAKIGRDLLTEEEIRRDYLEYGKGKGMKQYQAYNTSTLQFI